MRDVEGLDRDEGYVYGLWRVGQGVLVMGDGWSGV